jgi:hypothetical protein
MTKHYMRYGLELECLVSEDCGVSVGDYHDGSPLNRYWDVEDDGSIHEEEGYGTAEFVSKIFTRDKFDVVMDSIKEAVGDEHDEMENLKINSSCGAHIHFSMRGSNGEDFIFFRKIPLMYLSRVREKSYELVEKKCPHLLRKYKANYFREYAKEIQDYHDVESGTKKFSYQWR